MRALVIAYHMRAILTQCFRGYAAVGALAAGGTAFWALGAIDASMPLVGYGWLAVAAFGLVVAVGMAVKREEVIEPDMTPERIEAFENTTFTGRPLELYLVALSLWAAVSFGWVLGGMSASGLAVVGYGWLAVAAYGGAVGAGIVMNHREDVVRAVDPTDSLETGTKSRLK